MSVSSSLRRRSLPSLVILDSVETLRLNGEGETVTRRNSVLGVVIDKILISKYPAGRPYTLHHRMFEQFEDRKRAHQLAVLEARVTIEWRA